MNRKIKKLLIVSTVIVIVVIVLLNLNLMPFISRYSSVYASPLNAYTCFALDILQDVYQGKNTVISPLSIYIALLMLTEGTRGETRKELMEYLHIDNLTESRLWFKQVLLKILNTSDGTTILIANSIWVQKDFPINEEYIENLRDYYRAELHYVDFSSNPLKAAEEINMWVRNKTNGLIDRIIQPDSIDTLTRIIIVNTLYFYGLWVKEFEEETIDTFYSPEGPIETKFMKGEQTIQFIDKKEFIAIALRYKGTSVRFVVIMPKNGDIEEFIKKLDYTKLLQILDELFSSSYISSELYMPTFDIDSGFIDLKSILESKGVKSLFIPGKADLSYMLKEEYRDTAELYVKTITHRARIKVHLKGTEAAAVTAVPIYVTGLRGKLIKINKPFLFMLVEPEFKTILFMGIFVRP